MKIKKIIDTEFISEYEIEDEKDKGDAFLTIDAETERLKEIITWSNGMKFMAKKSNDMTDELVTCVLFKNGLNKAVDITISKEHFEDLVESLIEQFGSPEERRNFDKCKDTDAIIKALELGFCDDG